MYLVFGSPLCYLLSLPFILFHSYWDCVALLWRMYQLSGLVHADLGSYNLLVHKGTLVVIDLAQVRILIGCLLPFVI